MANVKKNNYHNRKYLAFSDDPLRLKPRPNSLHKKHEDVTKLIKYIDDNIVGKNNAFYGPFGRRKVVFCDYTASGRSVQFLEDYILKEVLPCYGNTHSNTSITSLQSALFRQESRDIIRTSVNGSEQDAVIFTGHGCTGALQRLISALGLQEPPIVFVGHSEHHSSLSPWREIGAKIVRILETKEGFLDLNDLEDKLKNHQNSRQLIGCFCAASNITGALSDDIAATVMLHQYGALSFWDYTIAAPCATMNMNPDLQGDNAGYKDAIFFAGHKFIGGVQTPGILVAKKSLFQTYVTENPTRCGMFITDSNKCMQELELREEGGTAAVVETIRAGLVMQLKETVGINTIMQRAEKITKQMVAHIRTIPEVTLLGNGLHTPRRLPIFSFMVRHPRGTFLHHNFVCAILNDVFGIQARSGCGCAGPYAQDLLGISADLAAKYENILLENMRLDRLQLKRDEHSSHELLRPGFTRISLPYFMSDSEVAFVMEALKMVATEGWKLLPQYVMVAETGEWRHHTNGLCKDRKWLSSIRYVDGKMTMNERRISGPGVFPQTYQDCLQTARNLFNRSRKSAHRTPLPEPCVNFDDRSSRLRWFMLPSEAQDLLLGNSQNVKHDVPFDPAVTHRRSLISESNDLEMISISAPLSSNNSSPKHFSLSLDDQKFKNDVKNGYQFNYPATHRQVSESDENDIKTFNYDFYVDPRPQNINFAIGGNVSAPQNIRTSGNVSAPAQHAPAPSSRERCYYSGNVSAPPQSDYYAETRPQNFHTTLRERCYSLNSVSALSPQTRASLGMHANARQRQCSCSSQTDLQSIESDLNLSPTHSLSYLSDCSIVGRASPHFQTQESDDLQAYVEEVTKELATTIKSEIRGVISKVEDVLENTESCADRHSGSEDGRSDSISVNEVAEYIVEVSKNMANEVKSEIRDVVSAVDVFIAPEAPEDRTCSGAIPKRISPNTSVTKLNDDDDKKRLWPLIGSISSQDSGINLSFHEHETFNEDQRSHSEGCKKLQKPERKRKSADFSTEQIPDESETWCAPPKNIWNSALEAINEFNMIKNGDKVMICISGSHDSLSLLHVLHHYQDHAKAKNMHFTIGAALFNSDNQNHPLISYLEQLGVQYVFQEPNLQEEDKKTEKLKQCSSLTSLCSKLKCGQLYTVAKNSGYNVLAVSQHLDDLAEDFLLSLFHSGRLRSMKAHYNVGDDNLRVIRPFIYVREKVLKQFAEVRNLPILNENSTVDAPKERHRTKQLLAQQEILFPSVFWNVRKALQPLLRPVEVEHPNGRKQREDSNSISIYIESDTDEEPVFFPKRV